MGSPKSIMCKSCSSSDHLLDDCPSLPGPRTLPTQTMLTSATNFNKGVPCAPTPAPADTSATNLEARQPILQRTTMICPTRDSRQSQIAALAIPPEVVPNYLSNLFPSTPIDVPPLSSYLHDLPDHAVTISFLAHSRVFGFQGAQTPKEYFNLLSARDNPSIIIKNILKEVQLGHTAGPFFSPSFPNSQVIPLRLFQRNTPPIGVQCSKTTECSLTL